MSLSVSGTTASGNAASAGSADGAKRRAAPAQAEQRDWMRRLLGPLHVYGVIWYRLHQWAVRVLPNWLLGPLIAVFAVFFYLCLHRIRRAVGSNLDTVLGPCGFFERQRRVLRNLYVYSWCLTERWESLSGVRTVTPFEDNLEIFHRLNATGTGFVLVTAHIGHWEVGSAYPSDLQTRHVHVVREEEIDESAQQFFEELLGDRGNARYTVHFANRDAKLGPKLLLALRKGEIVALQGDRPARGGRTATVRMFDRPFVVPVGPAAIARSAEVPMLPVFIYRESRLRARVVVREPIYISKSADRDRDLHEALQNVAREVEAAIRHDPYQWFCFREVWPKKAGSVDTDSDTKDDAGEPSEAHEAT